MTTLLTLTKESRCVIPEDVKVICAQLSDGALTYLVVNGKEMADYWVFKDKMTYKTPLVLWKGDILELSSDVTANIVIEKIDETSN
jgi:hypothetical protein